MKELAFMGLAIFFSCLGTGLFILKKNNKAKENLFFFYTCLSVAIYGLGYFIWQISSDIKIISLGLQIAFIGALMAMVFFEHFLFEFFEIIKRKKIKLFSFYFLSLAFIISIFYFLKYETLEPGKYNRGKIIAPTIFLALYSFFWIGVGLDSFFILIKNFKEKTGVKKEQTKYILLSLFIAFIGGSSNFPMWFGYNFPTYPTILISFYPTIIAYAIVKHRFMDIKVNLSKAAIFIIVYLFVAGIPLYLGITYGFGKFSFFTLLILASLGPPMYRFLQRKAENLILANQIHSQNLLKEASEGFIKEHDFYKLLNLIIKKVKESMQIEFAEIFIDNAKKKCYRIRKNDKKNFILSKKFYIPYEHPLAKALEKEGGPIFFDEVSHLLEKNKENPVALIVPTFIENKLSGFLVLGEKKDKSIYTEGDINTFKILSQQTSLAIQNSLIMRQNKLNQERLVQSEKFSFIGGMAEGLAHQIRNRLSYFSLAATEIDLDLKEFYEKNEKKIEAKTNLKNFLSSLKEISSNLFDKVKQTDAVIQGIINYADLKKTSLELTFLDVSEVIAATSDLIKTKHDISFCPLEIKTEKNQNIYAKRVQLIETLYNLLDNSYEALKEKVDLFKTQQKKFSPFIKVVFSENEEDSFITIKDNGLGIKEKDKNKIFSPYFSTKNHYKKSLEAGIGLYTAFKMITEDHKGKIWFESEELEGTTFFLKIPKKDDSTEDFYTQ